jgi:ADP-ribose pyrophosphatase
MSSSKSDTQKPQIISTEPISPNDAKWLQLNKIQWKDQNGKERTWEAASRSTRAKSSGVDAVSILAMIETEPKCTVLIEQFRPPAGGMCIELPAGLVDESESPQDAAFRELEEETGFKAEKVLEETPIVVCDPGMTTANMKLFVLSVPSPSTTDPDKVEFPKQKLEEGEHIERKIVRLDELDKTLKDYDKKGFIVDARLSHFAAGLEMARKVYA